MESSQIIKSKRNKFLNLLLQREIHEPTARVLPNKLHVTDDFIARLGLEKELNGHEGCVNCLEWSENGQLLASASDDMRLIVWDPFRYKQKVALNTGHTGNVFSVKFLPETANAIVATGAGDSGVRVHHLFIRDTFFECSCHTGRVKRIATSNSVPCVFWTAAEDGLILQYDMRVRHHCKSNDRRNVLIDLINHVGKKAEAKCIAVNPTRTELIAVGANDSYVRMYDRRMIKLSQIPTGSTLQNDWTRVNSSTAGKGDPDDNIPLGCAQYFSAGHLDTSSLRIKENTRNYASTYLTFSADGSELLVNMGGEQVYLFDIIKHKNCKTFINNFENEISSKQSESEKKDDDDDNIIKSAYGIEDNTMCDLSSKNIKELPKDIEDMKKEANAKFEQQEYTFAINLYNRAINLLSSAAILYANRAAIYMKRRWDGDMYSALRDCQKALQLDPDHVKAHFRLARCLHELHRPVEAYKVIEDFQEKFPSYAANSTCWALKKDIKEALQAYTKYVDSYPPQISPYEQEWRKRTIHHKLRFYGHCNTTTDIKEANFFGNDQYIIAGSDDGLFFIWDRHTTNIVKILRGDDRIVNCLQPHPSTCLLATSGIERVIRLWSPLPEDDSKNEREINNFDTIASANQVRMNSDPFELMMTNMGYRITGHSTIDLEDGSEETDEPFFQYTNCRTS
ncbi:WD and tetratricopeptide repeats protein 1-like [Chelonus insularis]|uniref:WD and tetratricopeptide repeats protein 1-like n=1 Tax=Chelonus insularis TaxID=460826 RepID=UPI00158B8A45|nr:WD and tetratricopeptide repeats protein 1-like [Chelonus insularis]